MTRWEQRVDFLFAAFSGLKPETHGPRLQHLTCLTQDDSREQEALKLMATL